MYVLSMGIQFYTEPYIMQTNAGSRGEDQQDWFIQLK